MNIVLVAELFPPHIGGVEVLFEHMARHLAQRGHSVTVVTQKLPGTRSFEKKDGYHIYRVWVPPFLGRYFFSFCSLYRLLRCSYGADIYHATLYTAAFPAWIAAKISRKPIVITAHEVYGSRWQQFFSGNRCISYIHRFFEWLLIHLPCNQWVCVSESTARDLSRFVKKSRIRVVYNGIDYDFFARNRHQGEMGRIKQSLDSSFQYVFFYGRPGISKGVDLLVKSLAKVFAHRKNVRAILLLSHQPAEGYAHIIDLIHSLNLSDKITLWDPVPYSELPAHILAADIVVIPSLAEGFGFTTAESSALELPLVVSNAGSLPEVASGKVCFVQPNSVSSLTHGILNALDNKFSNIPKKRFTWDACISSLESLYSELTERS